MTQEDHILIEKYLKGLLSDKEKLSFEERLKTDTKFSREFSLEKQLYNSLNEESWSSVDKDDPELATYKEALEQERYQKLKETLTEIHSEVDRDPKKIRNLWFYLAAASVLILIGSQLFFNQSLSNQELYDKYVGLDELPSFTVRDSDDEIQQQLSKGEQAFDTGNFQEALPIFESALENQKNNRLLYIYLGLTQTELKLYNEAEITFNNLKETNGQNADIALWYQSLLYLEQDDVSKALEGLKTIGLDPNNPYHEEALKLMEDLKENE